MSSALGTRAPPDIDALLERSLWDLFWLPPWSRVVERESLLYTVSSKDQHALNQVLRVRDDGDLAASVAEVSAAHRGVTSRWMLARDSQSPRLEALLTEAGYGLGPMHNVRWVDARHAQVGGAEGVVVRPVVDQASLTDCIRVCERAFGASRGAITPARVADELGRVGADGSADTARVQRYVAYDATTATPLSSGGLNLFPSLGLGFLWGGGTVPEGRGRGAYRALVAARLARAAERGCPLVAIYARHGTSDPIVAALGFAKAGTMVVWERGP